MFTYVVTSYTNPPQTLRLLARLRAGGPDRRLIVSHDRKTPAPAAADLARVGAELRLTPESVTWGDATYLRSVLAVIRAAQLRPDDWLTVLTGQDYPIAPLVDYEQHLASGAADMLLEEPDETDPHLEVLLRRYREHSTLLPRWADHHRVRQVLGRMPRVRVTPEPHGLPSAVHWRRLRTPFSAQFRLYKGADLFALSGRAADRLLAAPPALLRYYAHTRVPSESYVHTVLRNDPALRNEPGMLHYSRWGASPHPEWLTADDVPAMRASGQWFARKFHQDDPVLDLLDAQLDAASTS